MIQYLSFLRETIQDHPLAWTIGSLSILGGTISYYFYKMANAQIEKKTILDIIGNTPLIYLPKLSKACNCEIYVKLQYLNPFGSNKDRVIKKFMQPSLIAKYEQIVQASSGSTAISLAQIGHIINKRVTLFMPDDLAQDKYLLLATLKANIIKVPPVSIVDPYHFFNLATKYAKQKNAYFPNQFENINNTAIHYETTGPQIYMQTKGLIDTFICCAGTGGTIAGVSAYLKQKNNKIKVILADPEGSGLFNKIKYKVFFTFQEKQGYRLKNPFDTIIEGVGLNRPTSNFDLAYIDDAYKVSDYQALHMGHYLIQNQGLFVGGSSALNLAAVVKHSRKHPKQKIVTIIHDSGNRYMQKLYSESYLKSKNISFIKYNKYDPENLNFIL